jgi:hypothetical protein
VNWLTIDPAPAGGSFVIHIPCVQQDASPEATEDSYYGEFVIATFSANILLLLVVFVCYVNFVLIKPYLSPLLWAFFFSFALQVLHCLQSVCEPLCSAVPYATSF